MAVHVMRGDMKIDADLQITGTVNADLKRLLSYNSGLIDIAFCMGIY